MMMNDIRFQRMNQEYLGLRDTQDKMLDSLEQTLPAMMSSIQENRAMLLENREMLLAIIEHLKVPYKPPMGFNPEPPPTEADSG